MPPFLSPSRSERASFGAACRQTNVAAKTHRVKQDRSSLWILPAASIRTKALIILRWIWNQIWTIDNYLCHSLCCNILMVPQITQSVMCIIAIGDQLKCMYIQRCSRIMKLGYRYLLMEQYWSLIKVVLCIHTQRTITQYYIWIIMVPCTSSEC